MMVNNEYQVEELSFQIMQWLLQDKDRKLTAMGNESQGKNLAP